MNTSSTRLEKIIRLKQIALEDQNWVKYHQAIFLENRLIKSNNSTILATRNKLLSSRFEKSITPLTQSVFA